LIEQRANLGGIVRPRLSGTNKLTHAPCWRQISANATITWRSRVAVDAASCSDVAEKNAPSSVMLDLCVCWQTNLRLTP